MNDREKFVGGVLRDWIEAGLTPREVMKMASDTADLLEVLEKQGIDPVEASQTKIASGLEAIGGAVPWTNLGGYASNLLGSGVSSLLHAGGNIAGQAVSITPQTALLGLGLSGGFGYGAGKLYRNLSEEEPDDLVKEIHHTEMVNALRDGARRLTRRHSPAPQPGKDLEKKKEQADETDFWAQLD